MKVLGARIRQEPILRSPDDGRWHMDAGQQRIEKLLLCIVFDKARISRALRVAHECIQDKVGQWDLAVPDAFCGQASRVTIRRVGRLYPLSPQTRAIEQI